MKAVEIASERFRWIALFFLALSLAIVVIDNSVLNVGVPYIMRDLNASIDSMQWVISGYALIIATLLITMGRVGDMIGKRNLFRIGVVLFAAGSFIASIAWNAASLFVGEALIEAIGASMMMTSSLALIAIEFQGRERAIAFGIWGAVAGASAALGPLLGGYLTTYYSWRWSLRINVFVAVVALAGSLIIKEAIAKKKGSFDWLGMLLSATGLFSLVFGLIEGRKYGWLAPNEAFAVGGFTWPLSGVSVIPFSFGVAVAALATFFFWEGHVEKKGKEPLLRVELFKNHGFSLGLLSLFIVVFGQFGVFFCMPIFLQNALGFDAMRTGMVFLSSSLVAFAFGPLAGFVSSKIGPKWVVTIGMAFMALGVFLLRNSIGLDATDLSLTPALIFFGAGMGSTSAQLTNTILSAAPVALSSEASAVNATVRQIGTSFGIAVIGMVLASTLTTTIQTNVKADAAIPPAAKQQIAKNLESVNIESGQREAIPSKANPVIARAVKNDVDRAFVDAAKDALWYGFVFILVGALSSLLIPQIRHEGQPRHGKAKAGGQSAAE